jgi:hypothetical protein
VTRGRSQSGRTGGWAAAGRMATRLDGGLGRRERETGRPFQWRLARLLVSQLERGSCRAARGTVLPRARIGRQTTQRTWFGLRAFRSPLLRASSLFLRVLRCFSSPGSPTRPYVFGPVCHGLTVADCSIRAPSDHCVGATPRGVSPRPRALKSLKLPLELANNNEVIGASNDKVLQT